MSGSALPVVVAVVGPTASGKSDLAIRIAQEWNGEVINCDSVQVYRGFDIGTAKIPVADRKGVPHHLIDVLDAGQVFTAGEFALRASALLVEISARGRLPVLAGGTGFYLRALMSGLAPAPKRDEGLRKRLNLRELRRAGSMHRLLRRFDPATAARIHPNDKNKTMRALEISLLARRPAASVFEEGRSNPAAVPWRYLLLGLDPDRDLLYDRVNRRAQQMFDRGLLEEVQGLLASGVPPQAKPFESLGYKQALQVLQGKLLLPLATERTAIETRQYAKRQRTWFRKEPGIIWLTGFGQDVGVQAEALKEISKVLGKLDSAI